MFFAGFALLALPVRFSYYPFLCFCVAVIFLPWLLSMCPRALGSDSWPARYYSEVTGCLLDTFVSFYFSLDFFAAAAALNLDLGLLSA